MGTYTTNKNLFMPSVGETGWGTLVNGNFETIDNFLKPITVSGSTYTFTGNQTGGTITATQITNSGTLTNTGNITANGGIGTTTLTASSTSTFTGKITANGGIGTTSLTTSSTITSTGKITGNGGIAGTTGTFSGNITAKYVDVQSMGNKYIFTSDRNFILPAIGYNNGKEVELLKRRLYFSLSGSTTTTLYLNESYFNNAKLRVTDAEVKSGSWSFTIGIYGTGSYATSGLSVTGKIVCNGSTININNSAATGISLTNLQNLLKYPSTITLTANGYANEASMSIRANNSSSGYVWLV